MKNSPHLFVLFLLCLASACTVQPGNQKAEVIVKVESENEKLLKAKISNFFATSPSPIEIITYIKAADLDYVPEYMNNPLLYDKYMTTNNRKSVNLGVYISDLGYTCLYYKPQDAISYLKTTKNIFNDLGVLEAFDNNTIIRFERNLDNRDSLITILRESVVHANEYLEENDRTEIAAMILTGSWIEGMFMATHSVKGREDKKNVQPIVWKIGEQKATLDTLIAMVALVEDQGFSQKMYHQLSSLRKEFDQVQVEATDEVKYVDIATVDSISQVTELTVINEQQKVQISIETLQRITAKVAGIRASIVE